MSNKLIRMLMSQDKHMSNTHGPNGVLSRLFRQILIDLNVGPQRYGTLMRDYITDQRNLIPANKRDQTSERGNINKEFYRSQMTWRVFMKGLRFLQFTKVRFIIQATHTNGTVTEHATVIDLGTRREAAEFHDKLDQAEEHETVPYVQVLDQDRLEQAQDTLASSSHSQIES